MIAWHTPWVRRSLTVSAVTVVLAGIMVVVMPASAEVSTIGAITGLDGQCVDAAGPATAGGTGVQLYTCNGSSAQQWTLAMDGTVRAYGRCLGLPAGATANGTSAALADCTGATSQQWLYTSGNTLVSPYANKCLDAAGRSSANRTRLQVWTCTGRTNQRWLTAAHPVTSKRVVAYYQTHFPAGDYLSPIALTGASSRVTDLVVGALHLTNQRTVLLNDAAPDAPSYARMWADLATVQAAGVRVTGMVGGPTTGTFRNLETDFATYYPLLKGFVGAHHLDGVDLDIREPMSLAAIEKVISALHADFGPTFVITMSPVASALTGGTNLSGFDYERLYREMGSKIAWYNVQFYNGWGSAANPIGYDAIVHRSVVPPQKLVATVLTNPANGASGYVELATLKSVISSLVTEHQDFGGVSGREYFNALPGGQGAPWDWATTMAAVQGPR